MKHPPAYYSAPQGGHGARLAAGLTPCPSMHKLLSILGTVTQSQFAGAIYLQPPPDNGVSRAGLPEGVSFRVTP